MAPLGIRSRSLAVGVGRLNHRTVITTNSRLATKLGFLSVALPPPAPSTKLDLLSLPLLPPHWFSTKCSYGIAHSTPTEVPPPPPTDPHTCISRESHPFLRVCPYTPAPPFPDPQSLPFCKSQLMSTIHNLMISHIIYTGHFRGSESE